jgi:hypothetical protein
MEQSDPIRTPEMASVQIQALSPLTGPPWASYSDFVSFLFYKMRMRMTMVSLIIVSFMIPIVGIK